MSVNGPPPSESHGAYFTISNQHSNWSIIHTILTHLKQRWSNIFSRRMALLNWVIFDGMRDVHRSGEKLITWMKITSISSTNGSNILFITMLKTALSNVMHEYIRLGFSSSRYPEARVNTIAWIDQHTLIG